MQEDTKDYKIKQYYPMIYKYVLVRLGNDSEVMDIVQETLYKYLQTTIFFPNENKEKAWLFTVASNLCKNYWRSSWYKHVIPISDKDIPSIPGPEYQIENDEENKKLLKSVLSLPAKYKEVIHLYYYEDLSITEISQITGRKTSTVQTQLERGRNLIRKELRANNYE